MESLARRNIYFIFFFYFTPDVVYQMVRRSLSTYCNPQLRSAPFRWQCGFGSGIYGCVFSKELKCSIKRSLPVSQSVPFPGGN